MDLNKEIELYMDIIENDLKKALTFKDSFQNTVYESMNYSIFAGGKRIRPILLLKTFELVSKKSFEEALPFASAIEMIHTYSLIHDDLPAMDNDDFRRGKPTNHKVYGESMAILAGDALLNLAYETMINSVPKDSKNINGYIEAIKVVGKASGVNGMIGGQAVDMLSNETIISEEQLKFIHNKKTSALIEASIIAGGLLAGGSEEQISALRNYGKSIGLCFQIRDDILDEIGDDEKLGKSVGSDQSNQKLTYLSLYGLKGSIEKTQELYKQAVESLEVFKKEDVLFFDKFAEYLVYRES